MSAPLELRIRCTECEAVVAWVEKRHGEGAGRFELVDVLDGCEHAGEKDVRRWFYTARLRRAELDLPLTMERAVRHGRRGGGPPPRR